ncbi:MAG: IPT/TIG domain-containing protein [Myxococcales bacterium]|nr:IPT/TIG domain-containing protein [Myxococcales bacterium]
MPAPSLTLVVPPEGVPGGGELVRLVGMHFAQRMRVWFGDQPAVVVGTREEAGQTLADVRSPSHVPGEVDLVLENLDARGSPVAGERSAWPRAYRYARTSLAREGDLTRLIRQLLQLLKQQVLENTSTAVSVEYDDMPGDGVSLIYLAKLPAVSLTGPTLRRNRFYSQNVLREEVVVGSLGPELARFSPTFTVDLVFSLTGVSTRTTELLHLMTAVARFLHRQRWLQLPRDAADDSLGSVRWEIDAEGDLRTLPDVRDNVHAFSCSFVVRGFDIDEGQPVASSRPVVTPELQTRPFDPGDP